MITFGDQRDAQIDAYLAQPSVRAILRLESWLDNEMLAPVVARSGRIRWDGPADLGGLLDVDIQVDGMAALSPSHPLGPYGQVLRAWWSWPDLAIEVPASRWLINLPSRVDRLFWNVKADPEGLARLKRDKWFADQTFSGAASAQIAAICDDAGVLTTPDTLWIDDGSVPDTVGTAGTSTLDTLRIVTKQIPTDLVPSRIDGSVILTSQSESTTPLWTVDSAVQGIMIEGAINEDLACNAVQMSYQTTGTPPTTVSYTSYLRSGPRWWDGPYGRVPRLITLPAPVTDDQLHTMAAAELRAAQLRTSSIRVTCRADPRWEVGDIWRAVSTRDQIDAICRCTAIEIDIATGLATVEGAVIQGTVAGVSTAFTDLGL